MKRYKKDIPLNVLKTLEPYMKTKSEYYKLIDPKDSMLLFEDHDERSNFHFEIKSFSYPQSILHLAITFSPKSADSTESISYNVKSKDLEVYFNAWIKLLTQYSEVSIYDDPILKQYQDEFFHEYKIIDDDADNASFDLQTQFWLHEYCEIMTLKLGEMKTVENANEIIDIQNDINELKNCQSALTKNEVVTRLSLIWAKSRKLGINFLNEIYTKIITSIRGKINPLKID